mmetsp:Transcript_24636/g.49971  ORF Transcript_24636/g.49971 Transcript_24636/m.49971 type:complete len:152 (+) Transcript_24636:363-818(+)
MILLDAVEPAQRLSTLKHAEQCGGWVVITSKQDYGLAIQQQLERMGEQHRLLQKHSAKVYAKNWWKSGDKRQHKGGELFYWRPQGAPDLKLEEMEQLPPVPLFEDWREDIMIVKQPIVSTSVNELEAKQFPSGAKWALSPWSCRGQTRGDH